MSPENGKKVIGLAGPTAGGAIIPNVYAIDIANEILLNCFNPGKNVPRRLKECGCQMVYA